MTKTLCIVMLLAAACGARGSSAQSAPIAPAAAAQTIALDFPPNGLAWQSTRLVIADDAGNRLMAWAGALPLAPAAVLPTPPPDGGGLGAIASLPDGRLLVPRFGGGTAGGLLVVDAAGNGALLPGLDPSRRRIGVAVAPDGAIYTTYFVHQHGGAHQGGVESVTLAGAVSDLPGAFVKPVGIVATADQLYVSDQMDGAVYRLRRDGSQRSVLARLDAPDLMTLGPAGTLLVSSGGGTVVRIDTTTGKVTEVARGIAGPRGLAYDRVHHRLFVASRDKHGAGGPVYTIRVFPLAD